jgi:isonocardicin synthase
MSAKSLNSLPRLEMFLPSKQTVDFEKELHAAMKIPCNTQPEAISESHIRNRKIVKWDEPLKRYPQNIFTFTIGHQVFVGRKLISRLKLLNKLKELNCSLITASMILGISKGFETSCEAITVFYTPLTSGEKLWLFTQLKADPLNNIHHPFVHLDNKGKERCSPPSGWTFSALRAKNLGKGEKNIREATLAWLRNDMSATDCRIVYDPACSTGLFLNTIKQAFPNCVTIGQDLSASMINHARHIIDKAIIGDARSPGVPDTYCDYIFVRFLNSEVVTRAQGYDIFPILLRKLKDNGKLIVFGHTPVLLNIPYLESFYGLHAIKRIALNNVENEEAVFQYYVLRRVHTC